MEQKSLPARGSGINPACLQAMLESADNAAEKGQSQFFTPPDFGAWCAQLLPKHRPVVVDINCGNGQLLQASATQETLHLLGSDIDPGRPTPMPAGRLPVRVSRITQDTTLLYPLLKEIGFEADCFALNPPWRLLWHKDRLADLAESECEAVRDAWKCAEPGIPDDTIDSTAATLMMALDLSTNAGEGFLIANNNTLDRLIFNPGAPFKMLSLHIWARIAITGNPMTGLTDCKWVPNDGQSGSDFKTGVIYFARSHTTGPAHFEISNFKSDLPNPADRLMRMGRAVQAAYWCNDDTSGLWEATREKVRELNAAGNGGPGANRWNVWLTVGGCIGTGLSTFESKSRKTNKKEAERLFKLTGHTPMEMVLQRNQRDDLLYVLGIGGNGGPGASRWKVEPALVAAAQAAVQQYHAARAPLYPLPEIQRLGYLDEQDAIECRKDLSIMRNVVPYKIDSEDGVHTVIAPDGTDVPGENDFEDIKLARARLHELNDAMPKSGMESIYTAGQKYSIRTQTVEVTRAVSKPNSFTGQSEELEFKGQELAIFIGNKLREPDKDKDEDFEEFCFMDGTLRDGKTKVAEARQQKKSRRQARWMRDPEAIPIDFTLQELVAHFIIPDVPDVATNNPEIYRANLQQLDQIEQLCNAM